MVVKSSENSTKLAAKFDIVNYLYLKTHFAWNHVKN